MKHLGELSWTQLTQHQYNAAFINHSSEQFHSPELGWGSRRLNTPENGLAQEQGSVGWDSFPQL